MSLYIRNGVPFAIALGILAAGIKHSDPSTFSIGIVGFAIILVITWVEIKLDQIIKPRSKLGKIIKFTVLEGGKAAKK